MPTDAVVINASRGEVVNATALRTAIDRGKLAAALLDVWPNEPDIDPDLVAAAAIATPHIAGYSADAKARATARLRAELVAALALSAPAWHPTLPPPTTLALTVGSTADPEATIAHIFDQIHPLQRDDRALRASVAASASERAAAFRRYRAEYPPRREFSATTIQLGGTPPQSLPSQLAALGFEVTPPQPR
jgi:erythronate-4-phosphate dehydrogenase